MFKSMEDDSPTSILRKTAYKKAALKRWRFLSSFDLSTIAGPEQLCSMISERTGISEMQVKRDVGIWMRRHAVLTG
jgi:hypothetical protein